MSVRALSLFGCFVAGCATTSMSKPEKMLGYTDHNLFVVEHHDPAHGGRIIGSVCAVDLELDAQQTRHGIILRGSAADRHNTSEGMYYDPGTGAWTPDSGQITPFYVETRDRPSHSERDIFGTVGDAQGQPDPKRQVWSHSIDLKLTRETVSGQVGARVFDLQARGDDYVGTMELRDHHMPFVLRGAAQLWAMPAAAQAAILPLLLTCTEPTRVIQMVDLRQSDTPPPSPPAWLASPSPSFGGSPSPSPSPSSRVPRDAGPSAPPPGNVHSRLSSL